LGERQSPAGYCSKNGEDNMKTKSFAAIGLLSIILVLSSCNGSGGQSGADKTIKSTQAGNLTVTLASSTGDLKSGDNDLYLTFADSSGKPVDVGAASLKFRMPAMGSMAEMNDDATLTTTTTPGRYHAKVNIEVSGSWEAMVSYEGPHGKGQASMSVQAK